MAVIPRRFLVTTESPLPHDPIPTVRGPVAAAELGITLAHEHLFVLSSEFQSNFPHLWDREAGVREAVRQLERAYAAGVRTLVDMTVLGQGRDIGLVRAVAERTPVNIVLATGVYSVDGIPLFARFRGPGAPIESEAPLIELLLSDITTGIADSGVRAGLVKFACERTPPDAAAHRMAAVVAEVRRQTGVPVVVHCDPFEGNGIALVRLLEKEGVAAGSVVMAHAGDSADLEGLRALADTGCVLGYDRYGMTPFAPTSSATPPSPHSYGPGTPPSCHPWVTVVLCGAHGESLDENGELIKTVTLVSGQVVHNRGESLPMRRYVRNLSDQTLVMVAIELRTPTAPEEGPSS
ncbi:phosphotriesterase family protein [Streptomyces sp. NPDC055059]|uniref:phosphotriesterase family protein n=1 Tax=Streptomyces sp. NPDC127172 TaxID=3345382 RepID=UPI00363D0248